MKKLYSSIVDLKGNVIKLSWHEHSENYPGYLKDDYDLKETNMFYIS